MAVKTETLEHGERALDLENRENTSAVQTRETKPAKKPPLTAEEQLAVFRKKIRAAQNVPGVDPRPKDAPACKDCFQRGWMAALQSLED